MLRDPVVATMELLPDSVCMLCNQNTSVLTSQNVIPYVKFMKSTFFDTNKHGFNELQNTTPAESLCVLCTYKVIIAHKFKNAYEDVVKKQSQTSFKKTVPACLLCKSKSADLVSIDDNPNDVNTKIKAFMNATLYPCPYIQCVACFDCLFCLSIWFETYAALLKKFNLEDVLTNLSKEPSNTKVFRKIQPTSSNDLAITKTDTVLMKDKENVTPENSEAKSNKKSCTESDSPVGMRSRKRLSLRKVVSDENSDSSTSKRMKSKETTLQSPTLHLFLKTSLKHLKTIKQVNNRAKWSADILNDKKMFQEIPYILVVKDCMNSSNDVPITIPETCTKVTPKGKTNKKVKADVPIENIRKSRRLNASPELIVLSDSDAETTNIEEQAKAVKPARKMENNDEGEKGSDQHKPQRKTLIKIRPSKKFVLNLGPKSAKKGRKGRLARKDTTHTCNVCDEVFSLLCDYKKHNLWHEKPEIPKVDIIRRELPKYTNISEFNPNHISSSCNTTKVAESPSIKIDAIMKKYLGEHETETFEDADFNGLKEIDDIIVNLNSSDTEEKSVDSTNIKENKNADLNKQDKSKNSEEHIESELNDHVLQNDKAKGLLDNSEGSGNKNSKSKVENGKKHESKQLGDLNNRESNSEKNYIENVDSEIGAVSNAKKSKNSELTEIQSNKDDIIEEDNTHSKHQRSDSSFTSELVCENEVEKDTITNVQLHDNKQNGKISELTEEMHEENSNHSKDSNEAESETDNIKNKVENEKQTNAEPETGNIEEDQGENDKQENVDQLSSVGDSISKAHDEELTSVEDVCSTAMKKNTDNKTALKNVKNNEQTEARQEEVLSNSDDDEIRSTHSEQQEVDSDRTSIGEHDTCEDEVQDTETSKTSIDEHDIYEDEVQNTETSKTSIDEHDSCEDEVQDTETSKTSIDEHDIYEDEVQDTETSKTSIDEHDICEDEVQDAETSKTSIDEHDTCEDEVQDTETSRTSMDEHDICEDEVEDSETDRELNDKKQFGEIEHLLAEMHGESSNLSNDDNESEEAGDTENEIDNCEVTSDKDMEEREKENQNLKDGENEDEESRNKLRYKRKRFSSGEDVENNYSSESDSGTQSAKRVRFASDYQICKTKTKKTVSNSKPDEVAPDQDSESGTEIMEENTLRLSDYGD